MPHTNTSCMLLGASRTRVMVDSSQTDYKDWMTHGSAPRQTRCHFLEPPSAPCRDVCEL